MQRILCMAGIYFGFLVWKWPVVGLVTEGTIAKQALQKHNEAYPFTRDELFAKQDKD